MSNATLDYATVGAGVGVSTGILPEFINSMLHKFVVMTQSDLWTALISFGTVLLLVVRLCKDVPKLYKMIKYRKR